MFVSNKGKTDINEDITFIKDGNILYLDGNGQIMKKKK